MAANMQHMAGAGHMMSQQQQMQLQQHKRSSANQYGQTILARLQTTHVPNSGWHATVPMNDRVGKALELFSNITLGSIVDAAHALELSIGFEIRAFTNCQSKEHYAAIFKNRIVDLFKKRQANAGNLQNGLNANAQAQAHAQAQAQVQAQAMLNMQQLGRGFGPQQGFAGMNQGMPGQQMPHQQQMLQLQQQQMAASMGMANQAGRGMPGPAQQLGMGPGAPGQRPPGVANELARLPPSDREKVNQLALRMFNQASEPQRNQFRTEVRSKMSPQQNADFNAHNRDPAMLAFQNLAFQTLTKQAAVTRAQAAANMNPQQAAMMQQQSSQQRANNMMPNGQPAPHDFSQFGPSMESIKDQQMSGLMAQQAGQMVVPASGAVRNATPQPGGQGMGNQGQNQTPRQGQQPGQQQQQQQMKLNQASQQAQAAQMRQMHSQQGAAIDQNQHPTMNPNANRGANGVNPMGTPGSQHGNMPFSNLPISQRFQGNPAVQAMVVGMVASMNPEQQHQFNQLPDEKIIDMVRRFSMQQQQRANAAQMGAPQPQQQNQMNQNPAGAGLQGGMQQQQQQQQQPGAPGPNGGPLQGMNMTTPQIQSVMDNMEVPPPVRDQILPNLPLEAKKWRDLKAWVNQSGNISPQARGALGHLQKQQFQHWWVNRRQLQQQQQQRQQQQQQQQQQTHQQALQQGQPPPQMAAQQQQGPQQQQQGRQQQQQQQGQMPSGGMNVVNMPPNVANFPPHLMHVTPQEIAQLRASKPTTINMPDDQLRMIIIQMKRSQWQNQQANRMRAQSAASQGLGPQNPMAGQAAAQMGQQQNQPPQQQDLNRQQPQPPQQQPGAMPNAAAQAQTAAAKQQPTAQQTVKNLKRPSTDDAPSGDNGADTSNTAAAINSAGARAPNMAGIKRLPPQQIANMTPEQKTKYEAFLRAQMANKDGAAAAMMQPTAESINRLKAIGQAAARQLAQEAMVDIPMSPQELEETGAKLKRIVVDMRKVGRSLSRWFAITVDEGRASMFFKFRQRLLKQFADGDNMTILRDSFSMRSSDLEQARAMLESMARDLAAASMKGGFMRPQNSQAQHGQAIQQPPQGSKDQSSPAATPLNASNLEKNSQALSRQKSKSANQPPPAPTVAQAPGFPTNASSPHGNPSYMSKAKDMNLQIPPRKKQKVTQQPGQAASTPSPRFSKTASPEMRRAPEPAAKPVFLCREPDCDMTCFGFSTEEALKQHIEEEHVKPREDPVKFVQENLALALGLEKDGTMKKPVGDAAHAMERSGSKQGQDVAMKRSGSTQSRAQSVSGRGDRGTAKTTAAEAASGAGNDPWAGSTMDTQALLSNLGFENGLPTVMNEFRQLYRSSTPNDTPESSKDSGASEPNSDISEGAAIEIDMNWQSIDTDLLLNLNNTSIDSSGTTLDPSLLLDPLAGPPPDWEEVHVDFNKPFQFDTSKYYFDTSS